VARKGHSYRDRLTGLAIRNDEKGELLHLGISLGRRFLKAPQRYQARPEVNSAPYYLDTEDFSTKTISILNLETAYSRGPLLLQGECIWTQASGTVRAEDVTLNNIADEVAARFPKLVDWLQGNSGWQRPSDSILWNIPFDLATRGNPSFFGIYGQASYILTGEQRPYDFYRGIFGAPIPEKPFKFASFRGLGAWELAARLSYLDLNDNYIIGGRETNLTLGLNWYLNQNMRMALNYVHGIIEKDVYKGNMNSVQMRFQIDFQPRSLHDFNPLKGTQQPASLTKYEE
jgi:phosphate-selective porin